MRAQIIRQSCSPLYDNVNGIYCNSFSVHSQKKFVAHIILNLFQATYESESKHFLSSAVLDWHINLDFFRFWF